MLTINDAKMRTKTPNNCNPGILSQRKITTFIVWTVVREIKNRKKKVKKWEVSLNEQSFENVKYVSFPRNDDFDDLPIEYEHMLFTRQPIDNVTDSIVERLKVSSIERSFDKRIYESNPQNSDFDDLSFDGDERLIC